jgi:hypothetical protein
MLLNEGFDNVKEGYYLGHIRSQAERILTYIKQIEGIFNNTILEMMMAQHNGLCHMAMTQKMLQ